MKRIMKNTFLLLLCLPIISDAMHVVSCDDSSSNEYLQYTVNISESLKVRLVNSTIICDDKAFQPIKTIDEMKSLINNFLKNSSERCSNQNIQGEIYANVKDLEEHYNERHFMQTMPQMIEEEINKEQSNIYIPCIGVQTSLSCEDTLRCILQNIDGMHLEFFSSYNNCTEVKLVDNQSLTYSNYFPEIGIPVNGTFAKTNFIRLCYLILFSINPIKNQNKNLSFLCQAISDFLQTKGENSGINKLRSIIFNLPEEQKNKLFQKITQASSYMQLQITKRQTEESMISIYKYRLLPIFFSCIFLPPSDRGLYWFKAQLTEYDFIFQSISRRNPSKNFWQLITFYPQVNLKDSYLIYKVKPVSAFDFWKVPFQFVNQDCFTALEENLNLLDMYVSLHGNSKEKIQQIYTQLEMQKKEKDTAMKIAEAKRKNDEKEQQEIERKIDITIAKLWERVSEYTQIMLNYFGQLIDVQKLSYDNKSSRYEKISIIWQQIKINQKAIWKLDGSATDSMERQDTGNLMNDIDNLMEKIDNQGKWLVANVEQ